MCILIYPACQSHEIMNDHNQYCNTNNMFNKVENDKTTTIDNNFKESDESDCRFCHFRNLFLRNKSAIPMSNQYSCKY